MGARFTLPGVDCEEVLARHERNVEALRQANRAAFEDAHASIARMLDEVARHIEACHRFEQRSRAFEGAMVRVQQALETLAGEAAGLPDGLLSALAPRILSPLTAVCSFSEILTDHPHLPLDQRNGFLDIALKESERLTQSVEQILDFARVRSGRAVWHIAEVEVGEAVDRAVAATDPMFRDKAVALELLLPQDLPSVRADRDRLAQVACNLLANAAKFAEPGRGRVTVTGDVIDSSVCLSVADDGPGIPPERHRIIFARFLDTADTLSDEPRGTGIGLALSKDIVERLGGRIWVDSTPGQGARFSFTVPAAGTARHGRRPSG